MESVATVLKACLEARPVQTFLDFLDRQVRFAWVLCVLGVVIGGPLGVAAFLAGCVWIGLVLIIATRSRHDHPGPRRRSPPCAKR